MKIDPKRKINKPFVADGSLGSNPASSEKIEPVNPVSNEFKNLLEKINYVEKQPQKPLSDRLSDLLEAEDEFLKDRSFSGMRRYRQVVQDILNRISQDSVEIDSIQIDKDKKVEVVRIIHEKLDIIAKGLTTTASLDEFGRPKLVENAAFHLMKTMADIRGLIVSINR